MMATMAMLTITLHTAMTSGEGHSDSGEDDDEGHGENDDDADIGERSPPHPFADGLSTSPIVQPVPLYTSLCPIQPSPTLSPQ